MSAPTAQAAPVRPRRRTAVAVFSGFIAGSAWFGMVGLMFDLIGLPDATAARLPLHSPVLGGIALAVVVAVPATILCWLGWHGDPRTDQAALLVGLLLVVWILVEYLFIRELSFFHPTYLVVGAILIWIGRSAMTRT